MAARLQRTLGLFNVEYRLQSSSSKRWSLRHISGLTAADSSSPPPSIVRTPRTASSDPPPPQPPRLLHDLRRRRCRLPTDFLSSLLAKHPGLDVSTNPYDLDTHGHGESHHPTSPPDAVVRPTRVEEIRDILSACCRERRRRNVEGEEKEEELQIVEIVSVIPYGAGTSLEGHLQLLLPSEATEGGTTDAEEEGEVREIPTSCFATVRDDDDGGGNNNAYHRRVRIRRKGGISVDMSNFRHIGEVGDDAFVNVGAGVTRNALNEALRHTGMQFMVDPGADATIGGMTACAASGTAAVKYGTMRENILAMTAVLPPTTISSANDDDDDDNAAATTDNATSKVVRLGCNALKSSAGYNLTALLTGSEGTLGVLTEITVKLHPIPAYLLAASCAFDDLHAAAEAVATIRTMGIPVSRIELLDEMSIRAFNHSLLSAGGEGCVNGAAESVADDHGSLRLKPMELRPTLFVEFASHSEICAYEDLSAARNICNDFGGMNFASASDEYTRRALWAARHRLYYSAIALRAGAGGDGDDDVGPTSRSTIVTDVCVPLSRFADIITATADDVREKGVVGPCFGHAGDGNFHCILPLRKDDTNEYRDSVTAIIENMTNRAISVGGTCTGEHGIGYGKKKYLAKMYGEGGVSMMAALKKSIDPWNILNPGKIVDNDFYDGSFHQ